MEIRPYFWVLFLLLCSSSNVSTALDCQTKTNIKLSPSKSLYSLTVDKSGEGSHASVQEAIDSVPSHNNVWIRILVNPGIYREKVTIPYDKECIVLEGSGRSQTKITWNGHGPTNASATFTANAANFVAKGITFENSYELGSGNWAPAVAASILGDKSSFHQCGFIGFQDTLWDAFGRHYYNACYVEGAVDFIWGGGQSVFEDCSINVTAGLVPPSRIYAGYITAQGRQSANDSSGFVFLRGSVFGIGKAYLGRAYGPYSRVVFYGTELGALVVPAGWYAWTYDGQEKNFMYIEASNHGAGADTSRRVQWDNTHPDGSELEEFSREKFIDQDGWLGNQPSAN